MTENTSPTQDKVAVLVVRHDEERTVLADLLDSLGMRVYHANDRKDTTIQLEDYPCDFLLLDMQLSDGNAFALLGRLRESVNLNAMTILVISDEELPVAFDNITVVVRPVALNRLRTLITDLFEARHGSSP